MEKETKKKLKDAKPDLRKRFKVTFIVAVIIAFILGFAGGQANLLFSTVDNQSGSANFKTFWNVYQTIQDNSLKKLNSQRALDGAIDGLVSSLNDPFSVYMTKSQSKDFQNQLDNKFEGIGAELSLKDSVLTVISPLPNSPAEEAGLKPKDKILKVGDKSTQAMSLANAVDLIRGDAGTKVTLTVQSGDQPSREVTITRKAIQAKSVTLKQLNGDIALVTISQFSDDTTDLMNGFAKQIIKDNDKGIIIDLRNNPGGLLNSSVNVASLFLKKGTVVKEEDKNKHIQEIKTTQDPILKDIPLVVLVNGGSASASEILSGAIQDYNRGQVIGETTYGKGTVQELIPIKGGGTLRLTVDQWLTPNGRVIEYKGIKPDIEIKNDPKTDQDEVIQKALSVLGQGK